MLTMAAAHDALATHVEPADLAGTLRELARGALLGAKGNSGTIIAQLLKGLADALAVYGDQSGPASGTARDLDRSGSAASSIARDPDRSADQSGSVASGIGRDPDRPPAAGGRALAWALAEAARAARSVVDKPVEGTVLSVADAAARAATLIDSDELAAVARAAARGAAEALARTPEQLPVLAAAGVVDAGGRGLCVLLNALVEVVTGAAPAAGPLPAPVRAPVRETGSSDFAYEVQYLLDAPAVDTLKTTLAGLGDSLVVVDAGDQTWNVHVHVNDIGAAIEAGIVAGRPYRIAVTRFADQSGSAASGAARDPDRSADQSGSAASGAARDPDRSADQSGSAAFSAARGPGQSADQVAAASAERGAVVVVSGSPLTEVFRREGAVTVPGPSPSVGEVRAAIRASGAGEVVVLPNGRAVHGIVAAAADEERAEGVRVGVVPTRSPVQALAALAVRDPQRRFEDDLIAMAEAAGACRFAEVTMATLEAVTVAGLVRPGDTVALVEGEVNVIGAELVATCRELLDRLLAGGGELVTLITGAEAPGELGGRLREYLAQRWPFVEIQILHGGQPRYPLVVGVE
jgi:DAK2 domain fusion protein YloV